MHAYAGTSQVQSAAKTKQFNDFNDGHVVDIAEIGAGDSGEQRGTIGYAHE